MICLSLSNGTLVKNQAIKFNGGIDLEEIVSRECLDKIEPELKVYQNKNLEYLKDPEYISLVKEYQDAVNSGNLEQIHMLSGLEKFTLPKRCAQGTCNFVCTFIYCLLKIRPVPKPTKIRELKHSKMP